MTRKARDRADPGSDTMTIFNLKQAGACRALLAAAALPAAAQTAKATLEDRRRQGCRLGRR